MGVVGSTEEENDRETSSDSGTPQNLEVSGDGLSVLQLLGPQYRRPGRRSDGTGQYVSISHSSSGRMSSLFTFVRSVTQSFGVQTQDRIGETWNRSSRV